jgi:hypothetical protein
VADFPELEPTGRSYDFGSYAMSETSAYGGGAMRFSHSSTAVGFNLTLIFVDLGEDDLDLIREHYRDQQGGYLSFLLPAIIWQGHSDVEFLAPATERWIYAAPPEEGEARPGGFQDVTVTLRHVGAEMGAFYG